RRLGRAAAPHRGVARRTADSPRCHQPRVGPVVRLGDPAPGGRLLDPRRAGAAAPRDGGGRGAGRPAVGPVEHAAGGDRRVTLLAPGPVAGSRRALDVVRAYVALTKPRIIELLLVATVPPMVIAA